MELNKKDYLDYFRKSDFDYFVLSGDIGGTHANLGISGVKNNVPVLIFSTHISSKEIKNLASFVNETLKHAKDNYDIEVSSSCFAVAGPVSVAHDYCSLINVKLVVDARQILKDTLLNSVLIINDFEAVAYVTNILDVDNSRKISKVRHFNSMNGAARLALGAGTGFGKCLMVYDHRLDSHIPVPSEAGHSDFPIHDDFEERLAKHLSKKKEGMPVSYEDLLSGRGIVNIYDYITSVRHFKQSACSKEIKNSDSKELLISKYKNVDPACKATFRLFARFYGRAVKNFILSDWAVGGVFIGGGIAAFNSAIFSSKDFLDELDKSGRYKDVLKKVPIYVLVDYDVSLLGAAYAAIKRQDISLKR